MLNPTEHFSLYASQRNSGTSDMLKTAADKKFLYDGLTITSAFETNECCNSRSTDVKEEIGKDWETENTNLGECVRFKN